MFVTGRDQTGLDEAVKDIGQNATGIQGDSAKLEDLDRLYEIVRRDKGHIDVLFASAGLSGRSPIGSVTEEEFDRDLRPERPRDAVHGAEGTTAVSRWRFHFAEWVDRGPEGYAGAKRLRRKQSSAACVCSELADGLEGAADSGECVEPRANRHAGHAEGTRGIEGAVQVDYPVGRIRNIRRDCNGGIVPGLQ